MALGEKDQIQIMSNYNDYLNRGIPEEDAMILAELAFKENKAKNSMTGMGTHIRNRQEWRVYNRNKKALLPKGMASPQKTTTDDIIAKSISTQKEFIKKSLNSLPFLGQRLI